jgi:hypothetical protein
VRLHEHEDFAVVITAADSNTSRTPRSRNSSGYFLGAGILRAFLSARTEPGIKASVKPSVAQPRV